ncbi:MAG: hypothetical protein JO266_16730 [Acidobacteria bacterium]|nr:hypothetical protein [Acidobacteriota bacterium]
MSVRYDAKRRKWIADVGTAKDGNRERRSFKLKRQAEAFENAAIAKRETAGVWIPNSKSLTVVETYQLWLRSREYEVKLRPTAIKAYRNLGKNQLCVWAADENEIPASKDRYGLARLTLSQELTTPIVKHWADQMLQEVSPTTVKRALSVLHGAINYVRLKGWHVGDNCVEPVLNWLARECRHGFLKPRKLMVGIDIPTNADANAYLREAAANGVKHEVRELLKAHCGLRISEVRGLLWSDVDLDHIENGNRIPILHIRHTASDDGEIQDYPKTDAGFRTIPLPPHIVDALRRWREACPRRGSDKPLDTGQEEAEQIARWLVTNPDATNWQIQQQLRVSALAVRDVRRRLGISESKYIHRRPEQLIVTPPDNSDCPLVDPAWVAGEMRLPKAQKIARYLWHNPQVAHVQLSAELGVARRDLWEIRRHLDLPKLKKGGRPPSLVLVVPDPNMPRQLPLGGEEYLVFPSSEDTSKPPSRTDCLRWAAKFQVDAGLKDTGDQPKYKDGKKYDRANHVWRHYFVTLLLSQGNQWKQIANLSGHANAAEVMNTYGHLVRDIHTDYVMLSDAVKEAMSPPKLRAVDGDKLVGTKMADFGTNNL